MGVQDGNRWARLGTVPNRPSLSLSLCYQNMNSNEINNRKRQHRLGQQHTDQRYQLRAN